MELKPNVEGAYPIPAWWRSSTNQILEDLANVNKGEVRTLTHSPGGRPIQAVFYGQAEPELKGTANLSSAIGADKPDAYYRKSERKRPVMFILGGVHGQEMEGMVAALSIVHLMETGKDLRGIEQPELLEKLRQLRLIVLPLANPDGRIRVPVNGWAGLSADEMTRWGQGMRSNGEPYGWKPSKTIHPMQGDIGFLGGYFDDAGVNIMHDNWADPMSQTTKAILKLAEQEGPELLLNLHSYGQPPGIFHTDHVPQAHFDAVDDLAATYYGRLVDQGFRHLQNVKGFGFFGLNSLLHHIGVDVTITLESPHGVAPNSLDFGYDEILAIHHHLFDISAEKLLSGALSIHN